MPILAPYAAHPAQSYGRLHGNPSTVEQRGPRDAFQRDRDRIIHSIAFRRLRHKTQVFVTPDDDHFRVRLTHSLEVAQIARTIARALHLNEDLTEALALAHDIGHPPFGHAGEDALKSCMKPFGGWDHNAHTIRILTQLEQAYPDFPGLNLSWEVLEGLAKHNGPIASPPWALADYNAQHDLLLHTWPSLEAQVAALADDIAYDNHDIDDGLRSGVLLFAALLDVPFIAAHWQIVQARHPHAPHGLQVRELIRDMIGAMVNDLITESRARITAAAPQNSDDVRAAPHALIAFSPAMDKAERMVKATLYRELYRAKPVMTISAQAQRITSALFNAYHTDPAYLPEDWRSSLPAHEPRRARHISDFVAGMTDRYALSQHEALIGPHGLVHGF